MKNNKHSTPTNEAAEFHLCGQDAIARLFGVGRSTVSEWRSRGAPIVRVGKKYQAQYAELWDWIKANVAEI